MAGRMSDFAPLREHLARERERGRGFTAAWRRALATVEDREVRTALVETRRAWRDALQRAARQLGRAHAGMIVIRSDPRPGATVAILIVARIRARCSSGVI